MQVKQILHNIKEAKIKCLLGDLSGFNDCWKHFRYLNEELLHIIHLYLKDKEKIL